MTTKSSAAFRETEQNRVPVTTIVGGGEPLSAYPGWDPVRRVYEMCRDDQDPAASLYRDLEVEPESTLRGAEFDPSQMTLADLERLMRVISRQLDLNHNESVDGVAADSGEPIPLSGRRRGRR